MEGKKWREGKGREEKYEWMHVKQGGEGQGGKYVYIYEFSVKVSAVYQVTRVNQLLWTQ